MDEREKELINDYKDAGEKAAALKEKNKSLISDISHKIQQIKAEKTDLAAKERKLSEQCDDIRIKGSQLAARKRTIEEMENNYEGYNGAVKFIMKSDLKGIDGVVAELMKVQRDLKCAARNFSTRLKEEPI